MIRLRRPALRRVLGLERGVTALAAALFVFGFGQELWARYLPEYLRVLGATALTVGLFGSLQDFLDAAYAYPGGLVSDRLGSRRALILFGGMTAAGFTVYLLSGSIAGIFAGLLLAAAWRSLGLPATFALIAEELAAEKRVVGFTVQAILKRLPIALAPPLGGLLLERLGVARGMRLGFAVSILVSIAMLAGLARGFRGKTQARTETRADAATSVPRLHPELRRLLVADCLIRLCEGLPGVFLVVWAIEVLRISPLQFGVLQSILMTTAILSYLPAAAMAERAQKKPFVVLTFFFFTLFPLTVALSRSFAHLAAAYVVGGLREIGEPARKALIADLADAGARGRAVGLYYAIRGFAVAGAAAVGGVLWMVRPTLTFVVATLLGALGTAWSAFFLPNRLARAEVAA